MLQARPNDASHAQARWKKATTSLARSKLKSNWFRCEHREDCQPYYTFTCLLTPRQQRASANAVNTGILLVLNTSSPVPDKYGFRSDCTNSDPRSNQQNAKCPSRMRGPRKPNSHSFPLSNGHSIGLEACRWHFQICSTWEMHKLCRPPCADGN